LTARLGVAEFGVAGFGVAGFGVAGNAARLQQFPDRPEPARALVAKPLESTFAAQGPVHLQGIGQV